MTFTAADRQGPKEPLQNTTESADSLPGSRGPRRYVDQTARADLVVRDSHFENAAL